MYLFDTDTITNILKPAPSHRLQGRLREVPAEQQFISTITVYEIVYGAYKSTRIEHHLRNLKELLLQFSKLSVEVFPCHSNLPISRICR